MQNPGYGGGGASLAANAQGSPITASAQGAQFRMSLSCKDNCNSC